ncbi:pyridoxal-dependent decarboxylase [Dimargaris cristalligena]|uniref:ornithine decarboxylase n=1 Tax=Dimargaris cristalligena TaxID=215637 RepID=A0A4P9ZNV5_9FUNG|nr:pyridoxal-dependent decarboxylase [Dimargaris cristalligena]|eukprot:RKP34875.1 pyridoxal-dependent decarboxylase [Dimargaris cristalligena]
MTSLSPNLSARVTIETASVAKRLESVAPAAVSRPSVLFDSLPEAEDAFFVADLGEVYRQYLQWRQLLPRVEPFYAVKCNPDPSVIRLMVKLGIGFDCASRSELQTVLDLGAPADSIVYANPCKQPSHLRYALEHQVRLMTFDNSDELRKVKKLYPNAHLLLRILTDDSKSLCQLGIKFGAPLNTTVGLLRLARELGLTVVGVSFHVGSGCRDASPFADAVLRAHRVFQEGTELGFDMDILDIGGGFPSALVREGVTFPQAAEALRGALDTYFPPSKGVRIIAEPGRYFVSSAFTLAVNIVGRRVVADPLDPTTPTHFMYYVNDGVYGSFNCLMFDHATVYPKILVRDGELHQPASPALIWGQTCDSIDCIRPTARLPELDVGDWLQFHDMGAYTVCAASRFNGFRPSRVVYTDAYNTIPYEYLL